MVDTIKNHKFVVSLMVMMSMVGFALAGVVGASEHEIDYGGLFGDVQGEVVSGISAIVPIAIVIFGMILAITLGVKVFRRLAK